MPKYFSYLTKLISTFNILNLKKLMIEGDKNQKTQVVENASSPNVGQKKGGKKHPEREKRPRRQRPVEQWNPDLITQDTVLDPLPKKSQVLPQPKREDFKKRQDENRKKIQALIEKKRKLQNQKFKSSKPFVKGQANKYQQFQHQIQEFKQLKQRYNQLKNERNNKRDLLTKAIEDAKKNNAEIKRLKQASKNSRQNFEQQLEKLQHRLITSDLSKDQQKNLNNQIVALKRKVKQSEPAGNVEIKIAKAQQQKQRLDAQIQKIKQDKQPLQQQCKQLREKMDTKNALIEKLKAERKQQTNQKQQNKAQADKEYQEWIQKKKKKVQQISNQIKLLDQNTDKIWNQYYDKNDAYWEQKHKLDFLEWQYRVKEKKIRQKKRLIHAEKQKQRQKEENLHKYIKQIQLCNFLMNYLKDLTKVQQQAKEQPKNQQPTDINAKLTEDAQWKKQKGLVVLQSKKSKQDEQPIAKKGKKNKKKNEKGQQGGSKKQKFQIPFNIQILFDKIKVLAPQSLDQCQKKIQQLKEREGLFERACSEQVSEQDKQQIQKIQVSEKKQKKEGQKKNKIQEQQFPTL